MIPSTSKVASYIRNADEDANPTRQRDTITGWLARTISSSLANTTIRVVAAISCMTHRNARMAQPDPRHQGWKLGRARRGVPIATEKITTIFTGTDVQWAGGVAAGGRKKEDRRPTAHQGGVGRSDGGVDER